MPRTNLVELLQAESKTHDKGITFIRAERNETFLSYQDLNERALGILHKLQCRGLRPGDELIFQLRDNEAFVSLFWACILGGIVPVPVAWADCEEKGMHLLKIAALLKRPFLAAETGLFDLLGIAAKQAEFACVAESLRANGIGPDIWRSEADEQAGVTYAPQPGEIAFIQFSSGSTGEPKGILLTHENLLVNLAAIRHSFGTTPQDAMLSWMPLTNDMGLIYVHLSGLYSSIHQFIMQPALFVRQPNLWLKKACEHGATQLYLPNFGCRHLLANFDEAASGSLNLSHVRVIANGAEPIQVDLLDEFLSAMTRYHLRPEAIVPIYALAEATVGVTSSPLGEPYACVAVDRRTLGVGQTVVERSRSHADALLLADLGYPVPGVHLRICNDENRELPPGTVGYIQICGLSVTQGYYNDEAATSGAFTEDGWLLTGDLGFLRGGRLVVTGRAQDIIRFNGHNYYPHDVERVAAETAGADPAKVAACSVYNEELGREDVLVFVVTRSSLSGFAPVALRIKRAINERIGLPIKHVIPVRRLPKTASGKRQRYKLGEAFATGVLHDVVEELTGLMDEERERALPRTELEARLVRIWSAALGGDGVGIHDPFLELCSDSQQLVRMMALTEQAYPGTLDIFDTLPMPTIAHLAREIEKGLLDGTLAGPIAQCFLPFPVDYMAIGNGQSPLSGPKKQSFHLRIEQEPYRRLQQIAGNLGAQLQDVLLALYAHLLAREIKHDRIVLPLLGDEDLVTPLVLMLGQTNEFHALVRTVHAERRDLGIKPSYSLHDLMRMEVEKEDTDVMLLFSHGRRLDKRVEWLHAFDFLMEMEEGEDVVVLTCSYNSRRLEEDALRHMHQKFLAWTLQVSQVIEVTAIS